MKAAIAAMILYIAGALLPALSHGDNITRTCSAYYDIAAVHQGMTVHYQIGPFTTRGSCGRTVPNRCRERARSKAHQCMRTHWSMPAKGDVYWKPCAADYPIREQCLRCVVWSRFCRALRAREITVVVKAVTVGGKGCPGTTTLSPGYRIRCDR